MFIHTITDSTILKIVEKSYELLPMMSNRSKLIAHKLNISIREAEYFINVFNSTRK